MRLKCAGFTVNPSGGPGACVVQAAKRPDAAAKTWLDVYQLAEVQGTTLLVAEASQALGDHFFAVTDNVQAARYYSPLLVEKWSAIGNDSKTRQCVTWLG